MLCMHLSDSQVTLPIMTSSLKMALGLSDIPRVAFVGSGGKTTALFCLAREYQSSVIVTATSHLEIFQTQYADQHFHCDDPLGLGGNLPQDISGVTLFSGPKNDHSVDGLGPDALQQVLLLADRKDVPLLIEADGSRRHPAKAPAQHEPPIPDFVDSVVVVTGISALGKPCTTEWVHRPEIYANLSGLKLGDLISVKAMEDVLCHPSGGLKNIPVSARRIALLNQADTPDLCFQACELAVRLLSTYQSVIVSTLKRKDSALDIPIINTIYK